MWCGVSRTMTNVLLRKEYPKEYTAAVSTRVSNALLVGEIIGQIVIGCVRETWTLLARADECLRSFTCDYLGRKFAIITTTAMIVIGGILATGGIDEPPFCICCSDCVLINLAEQLRVVLQSMACSG